MRLHLSPEEYPFTEEESEALARQVDNGEFQMLYGHGPCTLEEADSWYIQEQERALRLEQEVLEIENGQPELVSFPQGMYRKINEQANQYQIPVNVAVIRMLRGEIPLPEMA